MARERSKERQEAFELYRDSEGKIQNREIAGILGIPEKTVGGWKCKDKWEEQIIGVSRNQTDTTPNVLRSTPTEKEPRLLRCGPDDGIPGEARKRGAPPGNQNAVGNRGGHGAPDGNDRAATHGLYRRFLPQDEEYQELIDLAEMMDPVDMLWDNITIKYASIIRAQKIMFVRDQEDETRVLKKEKRTQFGGDLEKDIEEIEWEYQHAWDKHASFLSAQARAMSELRSLIKDFLLMSGKDDERRLKLEHMQVVIDKTRAEIGKLQNGGDEPKQLEIFVDYG